jgi:6,7-dimethyl-8-ribityllumazine synthase
MFLKNMSDWRPNDFPEAVGECPIAIVIAEFNSKYTEELLKKTKQALILCGVREKDIDCFFVPGSFEIPFCTKKIMEKNKFYGIITIGVILRGETSHFELVTQSVSRGIMDLTLESNIPIVFGILACDTEKQIEERISLGDEFAKTAIKMVNLQRTFFPLP